MDASKAIKASLSQLEPSKEYLNPLLLSSRKALAALARDIRASFTTEPVGPAPSSVCWVDSTLAESCKGPSKIRVDVWTPPRASTGPRAAVICFHGGGWIFGRGTDCSPWAGAITEALDAVVFAVNYRLAPSHPFPIPVEDAVDATYQIGQRLGDKFGVDPDKIVLSGFSAGGTEALSSWAVLQDPGRFGYVLPSAAPRIRGIVLFYPIVDWTVTEAEKARTNARPDLALHPKALTDVIDASYLYPYLACKERTDVRLSPGLMPDELLDKLPPVHLCLCEYDMLLAEGQRFSDRLKQRQKTISLRVVQGEAHAWDFMSPKESVAVEYAEATQAIATWLS